jgi:hypothetical protein
MRDSVDPGVRDTEAGTSDVDNTGVDRMEAELAAVDERGDAPDRPEVERAEADLAAAENRRGDDEGLAFQSRPPNEADVAAGLDTDMGAAGNRAAEDLGQGDAEPDLGAAERRAGAESGEGAESDVDRQAAASDVDRGDAEPDVGEVAAASDVDRGDAEPDVGGVAAASDVDRGDAEPDVGGDWAHVEDEAAAEEPTDIEHPIVDESDEFVTTQGAPEDLPPEGGTGQPQPAQPEPIPPQPTTASALPLESTGAVGTYEGPTAVVPMDLQAAADQRLAAEQERAEQERGEQAAGELAGAEAPVAPPAELAELKPGEAETAQVGAFWDDDARQELRDRWRELQLGFVDDPSAAVGEAQTLVDEAIDRYTAALSARRHDLDGWRSAGRAGDTEVLRVALRGYRDFLDRLLT